MHNPLPALIGAALIPLLIGSLWYSKLVFGNSWMRANRFHPEDMKRGRAALLVVLALVFSFMLSAALSSVVIHQAHLHSIVAGRYETPEAKAWLESSMAKYGANYRTFKHGAFHGVIAAVFMALPIFGIIALLERRSWKYVLIHLGFWVLSLALMGGVLCQFA